MKKQKDTDVEITLNGISYSLRYRARNMMALSQLTGKGLFEILAPLQNLSLEGGEDMTPERLAANSAMCSPSLIAPLICAGLAHHKEFKPRNADAAIDKMCDLLDAHADKEDKSLLEACADLIVKVLPAIMSTFVRPGEGVPGNELSQPEPAEEESDP